MKDGRGWSRAGFATGVLASVAGNVAHSFVRAKPQLGAIAFSAFWPIALLISIEIISRVAWPDGRRWKLVRYGGLTVVAAIAATISYLHMRGLLISYGEDTLSAALGPLATDGLMVVSSGALLALAARTEPPTVLPEPRPEAFLPADDLVVADQVPDAGKMINGTRGPVADTEQRYQEARQKIMDFATEHGREPTGQELAELHGMSSRWWRDRLSEVKAAL